MDEITARLEALRLAIANTHGEEPSAHTVQRAEVYYQFLMGSQPDARPDLKAVA
jgi:hypothetical protein